MYRFACLHEIEMSLFLSFKFYFTFLSKAMSLLKLHFEVYDDQMVNCMPLYISNCHLISFNMVEDISL